MATPVFSRQLRNIVCHCFYDFAAYCIILSMFALTFIVYW